MSKQDIEVVVRKEKVTTEVETVYSILTCRSCKRREEFKGKPDMTCLPGGWAALTLTSMSTRGAWNWLMCPTCVDDVRVAAGLEG